MPMLIALTPWASGGMSRSPTLVGRSVMPSMPVIEKPWMSASSTPTRSPSSAIAAARFAVTEDLPTPPLPEETARMRVREPGSLKGIARRPSRRRRVSSARCSSVIAEVSTRTSVSPGTVAAASAVSFSMRPRMGQPSIVSRTRISAAPFSSTSTASTIPSSVMGLWISGSMTRSSASRIRVTRSSVTGRRLPSGW